MNRPWIRLAVIAFFLMAQVVSASVPARKDAPPVCRMKCCPSGAMTCCCAEPAQAPSLPAPASTPPAAGRELVPATCWVPSMFFLPPEAALEESNKARLQEHHAEMQPHVRLSVLFCSFLN